MNEDKIKKTVHNTVLINQRNKKLFRAGQFLFFAPGVVPDLNLMARWQVCSLDLTGRVSVNTIKSVITKRLN